ncbi:MAG TPA: hypothetical protein VHV32_11810 [Candidatus Angelobacter sp.]|jgi:hypothetical protein|nr:hypothetical protein [Candidatus Angelobacter sp.]
MEKRVDIGAIEYSFPVEGTFMTIAYMTELTLETSDFADFLREECDHVTFITSAFEAEDWATNIPDNVIVLFEPEYAKEAEKLKGRFVTIERKPDMSEDDVFRALIEAFPNLSTRNSIH